MTIVFPVIIMSAIGLIAGICLAAAVKFFGTEKDPKYEAVKELLPGANCGACGHPGCASLAAAIACGDAPVNACPISDNSTIEKIAALLNKQAEENIKKVAVILCSGGKNASNRYKYNGINDCYSMSLLLGGVKNCIYGCLGGGSCTKVCSFNAIKMGENGLPVVSQELCTGCGLCVEECPKNIIKLKKVGDYAVVRCSSFDKGIDTKKFCSAGCIGCGLCQKVCSTKAVSLNNHLAAIDDSICTFNGDCIKKCPVSVISVLKKG